MIVVVVCAPAPAADKGNRETQQGGDNDHPGSPAGHGCADWRIGASRVMLNRESDVCAGRKRFEAQAAARSSWRNRSI